MRKRKTNENKGARCQKCGITFPNCASYMRHYRREHIGKQSKKLNPDKSTEKREEKNQNTIPKQMTCLRCEITFPNNLAYRRHYRKEHLVKSSKDPMTCTRCQITFSNAAAYHRHYKEQHRKRKRVNKSLKIEEKAKYLKNEKPKFCRTCQITFSDLSSYMRHYRREHEKRREGVPENQDWKLGPNGEKRIGCRRCKTTFPDMLAYGRHYRLMHETKKPRLRETTVCEDCGKTVPLHRIKIHQASHRGKTFFCSICGSGFTLEHNLKHHMRIHNQQKNYICQYCNKSFIHWSSRRDHIRTTHDTDREQEVFECHICGKKCSRKSNMVVHMMKHTGEFKHECPFCEKRFISGHEMRRHLVTHTGEKNVICSICGKAFGTKGCLRQHMVTHTRERNYECEICRKTFTQCHVLRSHIRTSHPDHPLPPQGTVLKKNPRKRNIYLAQNIQDLSHSQTAKTFNVESKKLAIEDEINEKILEKESQLKI
ncbi:zinc finger protein 879-like isoform X2 [Lutzomyia longipalpis]|nr:zinc finger protein 879-like isoform X2 [Lutzomyia longipalpis]